MPKSNFVMTKRPPPAAKIHKSYRDEVRKDLQAVGKRGEAAYKRVVRNWSNRSRPDFKSRAESGTKVIRLLIFPVGGSRQLFIWKLVNTTGRRPGRITPRPGNKWGRLFFNWGGPGSYQAKTGASPARYGGSGTVTGGRLTVVKSANHKGFPARRFDKALNPDIKEESSKAIYNGGRRGIRRGIKNG